MPVEPPPSEWLFPHPATADRYGVVGVGADLEPGTVLAAYRTGLFPMPVDGDTVAWWSPDPRGILELDELRVSRSLRASCRRYRVTVDAAFESVIDDCRTIDRPHGWIDPAMQSAYTRLHRLGWAHSIEVWDAGDRLVGGLYGVAIGRFFAGESMFHRARDASKVALVHLVELMAGGDALLDVQWVTPHLASLGARELPRAAYLERLVRAVGADPPEVFHRACVHPSSGENA